MWNADDALVFAVQEWSDVLDGCATTPVMHTASTSQPFLRSLHITENDEHDYWIVSRYIQGAFEISGKYPLIACIHASLLRSVTKLHCILAFNAKHIRGHLDHHKL